MDVLRRCVTGALALALGACAVVPNLPPGAVPMRVTHATVATEAGTVDATWTLPEREADALLVLAPGFTRRCTHLRTTALQLAASGAMVLCIDAAMAGGNRRLAEALAAPVAEGLVAPDGRTAPPRVIVAGHSAGAVFAVHLGASLDMQVPERLAGALLFDPVATSDFEASLRAVSAGGQRPVLAMLAAPHRCNAMGNAGPVLRRVQPAQPDPVVVLDVGPDTTHVDIEGEDGDWLGIAACGRPLAARVTEWRNVASRWVQDAAQRRSPSVRTPADPSPRP